MSDLYIGLMTGTSLDGIDAALVDFSAGRPHLVDALCAPLPEALRAQLLALQSAGHDELHHAALAANAHSRACAAAIRQLLERAACRAQEVRAIGNHGQTIRHRPELGYTLQIGNHALLAELTGIDVVGDFRSRDVAANGQGAPLVPAFHDALFSREGETRVLVNVGGIANLTVLPEQGNVTGWDCGPGNVLMDAWIQQHLGRSYDADGAWAATGCVLPELLQALLAEPWFALPAPKSTGRDLFHAGWLAAHLTGRRDRPEDVQATLCALTAQTIADAVHSQNPAALYLCGGGAHNAELRRMLSCELPQTRITTTAELGVDPDWVEAYAFAWLARACLLRQPANLPAVTGAQGLRVLGAIYPK
ncbi:anhydro-N-acetylmuramic acid kinase [Formivibrio citricus]|uniref:Anhydro-N-acetylmuramic acid kinase n=1 Tax=Formivibrio citricus TaxID=83765 RepID=A0A1I4Y5F1_9NEIS|nr:anhydro-N-acetylmuramic acid kinase [Formivibrio citricus]SFN33281.1 anhydro-N-acetylmuramic acid kinase [Formivibrio citricus]